MANAVEITLNDNGPGTAVNVPQQNVQLVIGCAVGGTVNQTFATTTPRALQLNYLGGPLVEAAGMVAQVGNVALCISAPIVTKGSASAVVSTVPGGSSSAVTVTLDATNGAWDSYDVEMLVATSGTIGTPGIFVQLSLDAGRTFGPPIALGSANNLYIGNGSITNPQIGGTGIRLNFGAGTLEQDDYFRFSTVGPQWDSSGVVAALAAFQASPYGVTGVGSIHVVGDAMHGGSTATDVATIHTQLQAGVGIYEFNRAILELRDALTPTAWGGSGETETTWMGVLTTAVSGLTAEPRILVDGGNYNMPSPFATPMCGTPSLRRNLAWAHAQKRTQIAAQRRAGRVVDGPYSAIVVSPATDPTDGFVYHNELLTPGLAAARIGCATTWPKKGQGFFQGSPNSSGPAVGGEPLLSPPGSQFTELVIGNVLDIACDISYQVGVDEVSDDLLLQSNGTLDPVALNTLQGEFQSALQTMPQTSLVSSVTATVSPTANVGQTGIIPITVNVQPRGYVNALQETINLTPGG